MLSHNTSWADVDGDGDPDLYIGTQLWLNDGGTFTSETVADSKFKPRFRSEQHRRGVFEDWYRRALAQGAVNPSLSTELAAHYIDTQLTTVLMPMGAGEPTERIREQARLAFRVLLAAPG